MTEEKLVIYGDITNRLFASTLDMAIIYFAVSFIADFLFALAYPEGSEYIKLSSEVVRQYPHLAAHQDKILSLIFTQNPDGAVRILNQMLFLLVMNMFLMGCYFVPLTKIYGATIGKKIMGLKVEDSITGKNISWWQSIIRFISYVLIFGIIVGGFNRKKRCLHDYLADTIVVYDQNRWYKKQFDRLKRYFNLS